MPGTVMEENEAYPQHQSITGTQRVDERAGRSLSRDDRVHTIIDTSSTIQLPSPRPSPPAAPFPAFEITASSPITNLDPTHDVRTNPQLEDVPEGATDGVQETGPKKRASSSTESFHQTGEVTSLSREDHPPQPSPRKESDASTPAKSPATTKRDANGLAVRKLSVSQMQALTTSPESLPVAIVSPQLLVGSNLKPNGMEYPLSAGVVESTNRLSMAEQVQNGVGLGIQNAGNGVTMSPGSNGKTLSEPLRSRNFSDTPPVTRTALDARRPSATSRTLSQPPVTRRPTVGSRNVTSPNNARRNSFNPAARPPPLNLGPASNITPAPRRTASFRRSEKTPSDESRYHEPLHATPIQQAIPLPPMSLHTHLQLELAGVRPSPLYIYRHQTSDIPYESSAVKFKRLLNALLVPPYLETTLLFGTLACMDAFLYTFTLLPLRFFIAVGVLVKWWAYVLWKEIKWLIGFVWQGTWRLWQRGRRGRTHSRPSANRTEGAQKTASESERSQSRVRDAGYASDTTAASLDGSQINGNAGFRPPKHPMPRPKPGGFRHRRTKSTPSDLTPYHKADLLQGAVIVCSSLALMTIDASRMYHFIRAQSAMKLYVIFNLLEVGDRLLAAIGQDILECLFSNETLSRNSLGRSKILLPLGMFMLSLAYNVAHAVVLFYQVITLNVAVNSYSNALLSLLMSNQFVEIKGSVFKRIEKENLFQLTCADVVERFQLWIILIIIGMRNIVEVGGLSVPGAGSEVDPSSSGPGPIHTSSNMPASFTLLPSWIFSGEVLSPFLIVIGSEMLVDWIKHAYINKFNNVKPIIYQRMLDIFCKDYYTNVRTYHLTPPFAKLTVNRLSAHQL